MKARLLFIHALTPLHAGTGQGVGVIDLPIAREKATGLPYLPGSSVKGTLRDHCPEPDRVKVFGPETDNADAHASSAQFTDQRLLLLPVRSLKGTFAWVTSPYILRRLQRDAIASNATGLNLPTNAIPQPALSNNGVACAASQPAELKTEIGNNQQAVVLEDLDLQPDNAKTADAAAWAGWISDRIFPAPPNGQSEWKQELLKRFCIVPDEVMSFLLNTATEVTARISLDDDIKTVKTGGLWYEEALPAETILYGLATATVIKQNNAILSSSTNTFSVIGQLAGNMMQFGGKATTGRGLCRLAIFPNA